MKTKILIFFFFILVTLISYGQNAAQEKKETTSELYKRLDKKTRGRLEGNNHKFYPIISSALSYGTNIVQDEVKPLFEKNDFLSLDYRMGYQTVGNNIYYQLWRYPEWGIGYYGVKLHNDSVFGIPNAVFAYIDIPFNKWNPNRKWSFSYSLGGGLSFNFRPNNPQTNPLNTLIGSYNNVYIDLAMWANVKMSKTLDGKIGISFVHFSNGASTLPNYGMNLIGVKTVIKHHLVQERPVVYQKKDIPKWDKKHGLFIYQAMGSKQLSEHGTNYFNSTTSVAYKYWANYKGQWLAQLDFFYDTSANSGEEPRNQVPIDDRDNPANQWSIGLFAGYEAIYNRWSFVCGWGHYLWRRYDFTDCNYQRFGIRYRIYEGFVIGAGLKARTFAADYIEWSVGYNLF